MQKYLMVEADTNDADYVRSFKPVTDKQLNSFMPLIEAIKACKKSHNFPTCDYESDSLAKLYKGVVPPKVINEFDEEYVPSGEHGVHTITEIKLVEVTSITDLFG